MADYIKTFGAEISPDDVRDYTIAAGAVTAYPQRVLLSDLPTMLNQRSVGSCVAHGGAEVGEHYEGIRMSTDMLYGYRPSGYWQGRGMHLRNVLKTLTDIGNVPYDQLGTNTEMKEVKEYVMGRLETLMPLAEGHKIDSYARLYTVNEVRDALIAGMPVLFSTYVYSDFGVTVNGTLMNTADGEKEGAHCMVIWGYDLDKGFYVQNSWGAAWGLKGYCWMPAWMVESEYHIKELWAVADTRKTKTNIIRRTLRRGMRGDDVKDLQATLNGLGYSCGTADGIFGSKTYAGACAFQRAKALVVDGIVGKNTWAALGV